MTEPVQREQTAGAGAPASGLRSKTLLPTVRTDRGPGSVSYSMWNEAMNTYRGFKIVMSDDANPEILGQSRYPYVCIEVVLNRELRPVVWGTANIDKETRIERLLGAADRIEGSPTSLKFRLDGLIDDAQEASDTLELHRGSLETFIATL